MSVTLGISSFYHDSAAALVQSGNIVAAAQEERFTRIKGDPSFPINAINYCLEEARLKVTDINTVVFYDNPYLTFDRIISSYLNVAPNGIKSWLRIIPEWINIKLHIPRIIEQTLGYSGRIVFVPHHVSHAASAFFPSPFKNAAILTIDGVGEWATASYGIGEANEIHLLKEMRFPNSLGLLYSAFTYYCGFKVNSGEYKLMGLAPYGEPRYLSLIKEKVASLNNDGTVSLTLEYFGFLDDLKMTSSKFDELFCGPRRLPESRITQREMDIAASIQAFLEESVRNAARWLFKETNIQYLCMAGGVALNCVANSRILEDGNYKDIWIQPAAGDAGGALGAALAVQFGFEGLNLPTLKGIDYQQGSYLGPSFSENEIRAFLETYDCPYHYLSTPERATTIARAIADGFVVGLFQGRMEFGPRALGARSILADPRRPEIQSVMNLKIKNRESFRPFAPAVLAEDVGNYFETDFISPYMLLTAPVKIMRRKPRGEFPETGDLLSAVNRERSDIPAVTHWDYSARIQTVHQETNPFFHDVIKSFKELTGCAVLVNTSFNVRGEPIVCSPIDAYKCFIATQMDFLYIQGFWLVKSEQPFPHPFFKNRSKYELD